MAKTKKELLKENLRQDLLDQLERNGAVGSYYEDMVNDWLTLWENKYELIADLKKRSGKIIKFDSRGQKQIVNNESSDLLIKITVQMQKTLDFLGLKPPSKQDGDTDEDMEM